MTLYHFYILPYLLLTNQAKNFILCKLIIVTKEVIILKDSNFDLDAERLALGIVPTETTRGRKKIPPRVSSVQAGLPDDWTRATFIVRIAYLDKLKDFAYTERISIKEALDVALERFLQDTNNLLPHNRERRDNTEIIRLDDEKTYGIKEVAALLNRAPVSIYNYIHSGKLKAKKIANTFIVTESNLREFAENFALTNSN